MYSKYCLASPAASPGTLEMAGRQRLASTCDGVFDLTFTTSNHDPLLNIENLRPDGMAGNPSALLSCWRLGGMLRKQWKA